MDTASMTTKEVLILTFFGLYIDLFNFFKAIRCTVESYNMLSDITNYHFSAQILNQEWFSNSSVLLLY